MSILPDDWPLLPLPDLARLAPVQCLNWSALAGTGVAVAVKREDLLHPLLGGNKLYKLHGHLQAFVASGADRLATFGGAYSNHLIALAAAGHRLGVPTLGWVRGEPAASLSPTLQAAQTLGMQLVFLSRSDYRHRHDPEFVQQCLKPWGAVYCVPEGGGDLTGARGCRVWAEASLAMAPWAPTHVLVACGTGGTSAGVLAALSESSSAPVPASLHTFLALKGQAQERAAMQAKIRADAEALAAERSIEPQQISAFTLETNYSFGGYARFPQALQDFVAAFEQETALPLDPVYTAKLFCGIADKARRGDWPEGARLLVLHTGGLQGRRGFSFDSVDDL